jgi:dephospho-CoA kinase
MRLFGLTGGVGMGKSCAAQFLAATGIPVADTDRIARDLVEPGQPALLEIQKAFGSDLVDLDGRLRREALAQLVFADPAARHQLEQILHPRIRSIWRGEADRWGAEGQRCAVVVIPLLFEIDVAREFDLTICVACSTVVQWDRLVRRGWDDTQIQRRCDAQLPVRIKMDRADHVVWNDASLEVLHAQLRRVLSGGPQLTLGS